MSGSTAKPIRAAATESGNALEGAFALSSGDDGKLSVRRSKAVSPEKAYELHVEAGRESNGTYQVSIQDVQAAKLSVVDDSRCPPPQLGHAYVDFRGLDKQEERLRRQLLFHRAEMYGIQYAPSCEEQSAFPGM